MRKSASFFVDKIESTLVEDNIELAIESFQTAVHRDEAVEIPSSLFNSLCWQGSLSSYAEAVLFACDRAIELDSDSHYNYGSRGVAKAITGRLSEAIIDLEKAITLSEEDSQYNPKRRAWIEALKLNENPFTPDELEALRNDEW